jgi:hypothetical protein
MKASPDAVWSLVSDITNTGKFSPETFEAEWLDGAAGPEVGARFRGHVKRNERGPVYWTTCTITACEPGRTFGFDVVLRGQTVNSWRYDFAPSDGGVDVTESFALRDNIGTRIYWLLLGWARGNRNRNDMQRTLERIKAVVE